MIVLYILIILINITPSLALPSLYSENQWQVTGKSSLKISGATNINKFHCLSVSYEGGDTLHETYNKATGYYSLNGEITMKSAGFDCQNPIMNRDFAKILKVDEFPEIRIGFIGLKKDHSGKSENRLSGKVEITLAGKLRIYKFSCVVHEENDKSKTLVGNRTFRFSDFDLQPPQKLFGAVEAKDAVSVDFHLKLRKIEL